MKKLKLLYMGTPHFALPSLEQLYHSDHLLVAVVTQPDRFRGRGKLLRPSPVKQWALERDLPVLQPEKLKEEAFLRKVAEIAPDLIVIVAYGKILPPRLLQLPPHGCINLHASLLPAYRGAAPIERAVIDGVPETGVTVITVAPELDAGDIILQERQPVHFTDTAGELSERLAAAGARLLRQAVNQIASGSARRTPQDHSRATFAPPLRPEEAQLDWSEDALSLYNKIRGLNPRPGAYTIYRGRRLKIWRAALPGSLENGARGESKAVTFPKDLPPGFLLALQGDRIFVTAGDGRFLELLELQPAGKRRINAGDFYRGYRPPAGARLGE
ncbi:MAG: methionyl-tRNA formyltransferase [Dethiobacteria bacterium]